MSNEVMSTEDKAVEATPRTYAHMCRDGHDEIAFNDPEDKYGERCPLCSEVDRLVDGVRDHLISLGAPADRIDGAGCDSVDPLDFTKAEITQAFTNLENEYEALQGRVKRLEDALLLHVDTVDDKSIHSKTCARVRGGMCTTPSRCLMVSELLSKRGS